MSKSKQKDENLSYLESLEHIIYGISEENIEVSVEKILNNFDDKYPESFFRTIIQLAVFSSLVSKKPNTHILFTFLKSIQEKKKTFFTGEYVTKAIISSLNYVFKLHESYYLIERMIEEKMIEPSFVQSIKTCYFAQYFPEDQIINFRDYYQIRENIEELKKDNWKLHKELIREGVNPLDIAKTIRNDDIEKLQEMSAQNGFDFNQIIEPSIYERFSFINQKCSFVGSKFQVYSFKNEHNVTLINYAAFFGSTKCFKYLLFNGSDITYTGKYALAGGNLEIIHLCEQNNVSFENSFETTIEFHRNELFKYLYENKNQIFEKVNMNELGKKCIMFYNYELLKFLEEKEVKFDEYLINSAAHNGNLYLFFHFHKRKRPPNEVLLNSIVSGNFELFKYLVEQLKLKINIKNMYGEPAIITATINNNIDMFKYILNQKEVNINVKDKDGKTALIFASLKNFKEIVQLLLEQKGIKINVKDIDGKTALLYASEYGNIEIVKLLLIQEGIDINIRSKKGYNALMIAIQRNHNEIAKLLIEQKDIIITDFDDHKDTPLNFAIKSDNIDIVKAIIQKEGLNLNAKNRQGKTALILASEYGHKEIVKLLLEQEGIDINAKDIWGKTALIRASSEGHIEIVNLFRGSLFANLKTT